MTTLSDGYLPCRANNPRKQDAITNEQFVLIIHADYEAVCVHAGINVGDKDPANLVKNSG
jgi:hypothetical protein